MEARPRSGCRIYADDYGVYGTIRRRLELATRFPARGNDGYYKPVSYVYSYHLEETRKGKSTMKDVVTTLMILSVMLGFIGVGRLCWDTKWALVVLFLYALGALCTLGMSFVMYSGDYKPKQARPELQLRPNEKEWIVKKSPNFSHFV